MSDPALGPWPQDAPWQHLDERHAILPVMLDGVQVGIVEAHINPEGTWCRGSVPFEGNPHHDTHWRVEQAEPLTLSPSILCGRCGEHGWIRDGKWVSA
jgi:hypothetical protein